MQAITAIATVPAVVALVTVAKDLGLPKKASPLLAMLFGVGATVLDGMANGGVDNWYSAVSMGILLGLGASGLYEGAKLSGGPKEIPDREPKHLAQ